MKNNIFKFFSITVIFSLFLINCQKEDKFEEINNVNPFDYVGREHNKVVKDALEKLVGNSNENKISFTNVYISNLVQRSNKNKTSELTNYNILINNNKVYKNPRALYNEFILLSKNHRRSNNNEIYIDLKLNIQTEVNEVLTYLQSENLTLNEILNEIKKREIQLVNKFSGDDLEAMYIFYSTWRHSSLYWAPTSEGGEGGFDNYEILNNPQSQKSTNKNSKINWWKVGGCDLVGALVGCRGGIWGAVITGAGASVISIIMQW